MDNTVGSIGNPFKQNAYILGLWSADGYHRTSSFGLTTVYPNLANRFQEFLLSCLPPERLRLRIYRGRIENIDTSWYCGKDIAFSQGHKIKNPAYQIYVNSRPLLRKVKKAVKLRKNISKDLIPNFFAGRFDGDGSIDGSKSKDLRIVYGFRSEAQIDQQLLAKIGIKKTSIYHYKQAGTFVLYVWRAQTSRFVSLTQSESLKLKGLLITP